MNIEDSSSKAKPIEIASVAGFCGIVAALKRPPTKYNKTPAIKPDSAIKLQIHNALPLLSSVLTASLFAKNLRSILYGHK